MRVFQFSAIAVQLLSVSLSYAGGPNAAGLCQTERVTAQQEFTSLSEQIQARYPTEQVDSRIAALRTFRDAILTNAQLIELARREPARVSQYWSAGATYLYDNFPVLALPAMRQMSDSVTLNESGYSDIPAELNCIMTADSNTYRHMSYHLGLNDSNQITGYVAACDSFAATPFARVEISSIDENRRISRDGAELNLSHCISLDLNGTPTAPVVHATVYVAYDNVMDGCFGDPSVELSSFDAYFSHRMRYSNACEVR